MSKIDDLEKRLEYVENLMAIQDLHRRYIYLVNGHEWDKVINECFTEDATADIGRHGLHKGRAEITGLFKVKIAKVNEKWNGGHFVTQPLISINGDKATGCWMMYICSFDAEMALGPTTLWIQGKHDCKYVKQDGKWKISALKFLRPWPKPLVYEK